MPPPRRNCPRPRDLARFLILASLSMLPFSAESALAQTPCVAGTCPSLNSLPTSRKDSETLELGRKGRNSSIGMDSDGRFAIAYEIWDFTLPVEDLVVVVVDRFKNDGERICVLDCSTSSSLTEPGFDDNRSPSVALSPSGDLSVAWLAAGGTNIQNRWVLESGCHFCSSNFTPPIVQQGVSSGPGDSHPSAARNSGRVLAYASTVSGPQGLLVDLDSTLLTPALRDCSTAGGICSARLFQWRPCVAMRGDGEFVVTWAEAEDPDVAETSFQIAIRRFEDVGTSSIFDDYIVNQPTRESTGSTQTSPAVAIDDNGYVVIAWVGAALPGTSDEGRLFRVFARRFQFDDESTSGLIPLGEEFIVDGDTGDCGTNCTNWYPIDLDNANVTVALSQSTEFGQAGRFIVAWNTRKAESGFPVQAEVHAQYFGADGRPIGREFRVHAETSGTTVDTDVARRYLASSAQHTAMYGASDQVVVTWTADYRCVIVNGTESSIGPCAQIQYTILPPGYAESMATEPGCIPGDCNFDAFVDGRDIQLFVDLLFDVDRNAHAYVNLCPFDVNLDYVLETTDVQPFVCLLLDLAVDCTPGEGGGEMMAMGGGGEGASGQSESSGSSWSELYESIRKFAKWLKHNTREDHPELTDEQYFRLWKHNAKEAGLWTE